MKITVRKAYGRYRHSKKCLETRLRVIVLVVRLVRDLLILYGLVKALL